MGNRELNETRLRRLWAVVVALRGLPSPKAKGMYLQKCIKQDPHLLQFIKLVYDPSFRYSFTISEVRKAREKYGEIATPGPDFEYPTLYRVLSDSAANPHLKRDGMQGYLFVTQVLEPELRAVADMLLDKDLQCGLSYRVVNRVMANLGYEGFQYPTEEITEALETVDKLKTKTTTGPGLAVAVYLGTPDVAFGDLLWGGEKVGNLNLIVGPRMREVIACLRKMGIPVTSGPNSEAEL